MKKKVKKLAVGGMGNVMGGVRTALGRAAPALQTASNARLFGGSQQKTAQMRAMGQEANAARNAAEQRANAGMKINDQRARLGGLGQVGAALARKVMKKGGKVSPSSKRADGVATKGKTKGKMV